MRAARVLVHGVVCALLTGSAAAGPAGSGAFVDEYMAARSAGGTPEGRLRLVRERLARDPDDVVGGWLLGAIAGGLRFPGVAEAVEDSALAMRLLEEERLHPDRPAALLAAASVHSAHDLGDSSRTLFRRAAVLYGERGRPDDAFHVRLLLVRVRPRASIPDIVQRDLDTLRVEAERRGDPASLASALLVAGREAYRSDFERSLALREEALALLRGLPFGMERIECLNGIGNCHRRRGDFDRAQPYYEEALEGARRFPSTDQECAALEGLALLEKNRGRLDRALELFEANIRLSEASYDLGSLTTSLFNTRGVLRTLGRPLEARRMAERALEICRRPASSRENLAPALDAMATEELLIGRVESGRALLEESVRAAETAGKPIDLVFPLLHLADVSIDLGDFESARKYTERGLEIARSTGHRRGEVHLLSQLTDIHLEGGRPEEGLALALAQWDEGATGGDLGLPWVVARNVGYGLAGLDRVDEAIAFLDSATVKLSAERENPSEYAKISSLRAELLLSRGRVAEALPLYDAALATFAALVDPLNAATTNLRSGSALVEAGRYEEAIARLESGIAWSEEVRSGLTVGEERTGHADRYYDDYVDLARAFVHSGRPNDAFATLERSRSRELRRLYRSGGPGLPERVRPELAADIARVEEHLASLQSTLLEERARPARERGPTFAALSAGADSLQSIREELVRRVQREAPDYAREVGLGPSASAGDVSRALAPGEALWAVMVGHRKSVAFWVRAEGIECREIAWGAAAAREAAGAFVEALRTSSPGWRAQAGALADTLLGVWPRGVERLIVVADDALHCIPFESLDAVDASGARRLVLERAEVLSTPSGTLWLESGPLPAAASAPAAATLVAFGDPTLAGAPRSRTSASAGAQSADLSAARDALELRPLPHARREVQRIAARFPSSRVFVGDEATESRFFEEAPHGTVLHVAAHALVDDARPSYSGLVLASARGGAAHSSGDGFVQSFEVIRRSFPHELVTLSACDTGRGKLLRGEGLLGLSRAFRLAGARSLVVSLWEVDDAATADFMDAFYGAWADGATLAGALRAAKLKFWNEAGERGDADGEGASASRGIRRRARAERYSSPALWAPFVLLGSRSSLPAQGADASAGR